MTSHVFFQILLISILSFTVHFTSGLKCLQGGETGDISDHQPIPDAPVKDKDCPNPAHICSVAASVDGASGAKSITFQCVEKPADLKCEGTLDSDEGKKGNIGPASCEADGCNTVEFLKENCKDSASGSGPGSGSGSNSTSSSSAAPAPPVGGNGSTDGNETTTVAPTGDNATTTPDSTADYPQPPSYSTFFTACAVVLTNAGVINSKIQS